MRTSVACEEMHGTNFRDPAPNSVGVCCTLRQVQEHAFLHSLPLWSLQQEPQFPHVKVKHAHFFPSSHFRIDTCLRKIWNIQHHHRLQACSFISFLSLSRLQMPVKNLKHSASSQAKYYRPLMSGFGDCKGLEILCTNWNSIKDSWCNCLW